MDRKDFFRKGGRWAIVSAFGLLSGFLAYHQKIVTPGNCSVAPTCKNCGKFAQCDLPQAIKTKENGR